MRRALLPALLLAAAVVAPGAARADTPYLVGAARVDVTPPAFDAAVDSVAFPSCPAGLDGPRPFALEEPYRDVDGSGSFSYLPGGDSGLPVPEPYCDANANGRYDGIYVSGGVEHWAREVHDPIDARAIAISDGSHTVVVVSVVAQGIFENYINRMRHIARHRRPGIDDVIVSANHNESSPDTVGIYGAPPIPGYLPAVGGAAGENSGIDDYYTHYLEHQVATAAVRAYDHREPAGLYATDFPLPSNVEVELSHNFPTTNDDRTPAAIDPKVRVLQARDAGGQPIVTLMNLAAHNQEIGHSDDPALQDDLSSDWPGYFHRRLEQDVGSGMAIFLVGDNGSEEDPRTDPAVPASAGPDCPGGCYPQAEATGEALADAVAGHLGGLTELSPGAVSVARRQFFAPLENNIFKAAAALGIFGERSLFTGGTPTGRVGEDLRTSVSVASVGPDLQLLANPGEAFPALILGSPWGIDEVGCPERPNPPVPNWHASATNRFQVGLAGDMIGYEEPAWAFTSLPGVFNYSGPPDSGGPASCFDDTDDVDPAGHQHKLETEGAGPTASNLVAEHLTRLLDRTPDPVARIRRGRFIYPDGSLSRRAVQAGEEAVGAWIAGSRARRRDPAAGTILALPGVSAFGDRPVDATGEFMDYDGQGQAGPDITTRGMLVGPDASPSARYYLKVYPELRASPFGPATP
jgi:hypothetical protein